MNVIGGGGFAAVWRARTVGPGGFERAVAIKVMRPGRAGQKRYQDMLLDEARLVARIQHPNVTQIWEVGEDPRSLYFAMELVEGESLDELRYRAEAAGKTLPIRALFRVLADVCGGLHAAHELAQDGVPLGLVHRDVSPQNILVSHHGIAKLIDFGLAKARERLAADTSSGFIKGKVSFMAPEQARAEAIDRRADLWAIGAVAYDLIEGRPPFDGETELGRLATLVGPEPVAAMSERVPPALRAVVERTLQKDPEARPATALELKEAIEEALIESELETSADECARLFRPYFQPIAIRPKGGGAAASGSDAEGDVEGDARGDAGTGAQSVERPVSSTIEARRLSETLQLPLDRGRYRPLVAGAALVTVALGFWALTRPPGGSSAPSAPSSAPAERPSVQAPDPPASAAASASAAPAAPGSPAAKPTAASSSMRPAASGKATAASSPTRPAASGKATAASSPPPSTAAVSPPPSSTPATAKPPTVTAKPAPVSSAVPSVQGVGKAPVAATAARAPARPTSKLPDDDAIE